MADLPPPLKRGDQLRIWWLNMLLAAVQSGLKVVAGPGITVTQTERGFTVGLANAQRLERFRSTITAVHTAAGENDPFTASTTKYEAAAKYYGFTVGDAGVGVVPTLGRPVRNDEIKIHAARVGDECDIVRQTAADGTVTAVLHVFTEAIAGRPKCPPPAP